ncbi:TPA: EutN/CcmL family microcompartment protein [Salmonella enterica subsp. enterica serovar Java]
MHLARVTGAVVSTQKSPSLIGKKLLLVRRVSADGELVLLSGGSSARHVFSGPNEAIDLAVVGIVDTLSR